MAKAKMQRGIYMFLFICSVALGCAPSNGDRGGRFTFAGTARGPNDGAIFWRSAAVRPGITT